MLLGPGPRPASRRCPTASSSTPRSAVPATPRRCSTPRPGLPPPRASTATPTALDAAAERLAPYERPDQPPPRPLRPGRRAGPCARPTPPACPCVAALFDLGVSSPQLDRAERGFSYRHDAPLDMRMDRTPGRTAADVVNGYDEARPRRRAPALGDERFAARIARAIVAARPIATTVELAELVARRHPRRRPGGAVAIRRSARSRRIRIEVNEELDVLADALDTVVGAVGPGGRVAVISYHSGEDRHREGRVPAGRSPAAAPARPACPACAVPVGRPQRHPRWHHARRRPSSPPTPVPPAPGSVPSSAIVERAEAAAMSTVARSPSASTRPAAPQRTRWPQPARSAPSCGVRRPASPARPSRRRVVSVPRDLALHR